MHLCLSTAKLIRLDEELRNALRNPAAMSIIKECAEGLPFYQGPKTFIPPKSGKLYLVPTTHGEVFDHDFSPLPSTLDSLPDSNKWTKAYLISVIEILSERRPLSQIARSTHRYIYNNLTKQVGIFKNSQNSSPRLRRIYRSEPIEGVIEICATISVGQRVRVIAARFEGVDRRWICTEFDLL